MITDAAAQQRQPDDIVRALPACGLKSHDEKLCNEDTVIAAQELYRKGHSQVLHLLLALAPVSDGAVSEALGPFYADLLEKRTDRLLYALRSQGSEVQTGVCQLAASGDGGGLDPQQRGRIEIKLTAITKSNSRSKAVAKSCLAEIQKRAAE